MTGPALADLIRSTMSFPLPVSVELSGWGSATVAEIQANAVVSNASGTVTGTCPPSGGALTGGAASNGLITGVLGPSLASRVASAAEYGSVVATLDTYCAQIASHINTSARVTFSSGNITGACSNTSDNPGSLSGAGSGGTISGLSGSALAALIVSAMGYGYTSSALTQFCTAICTYIMDNATVAYAGTVTGVCPAGGGPLSAGSGSGGTVS